MEKKRILFVDDDNDYKCAMKLFLEQKYNVTTAVSAEEAMERLLDGKPDLIITDVMMEPTSGFVFAHELMTHLEYKNIPIVMLTALADKITDTKYSLNDMLRYEVDAFIEKSAKPEEIITTIEKLLENKG